MDEVINITQRVIPGVSSYFVVSSFPPVDGLWGWWLASQSYTETTGEPTTLITTDGTSIGSMKDMSNRGNHLYQTDGARKPTYKTSIIAGLPAALFASASPSGIFTSNIPPGTQYSAYIVFRRTVWNANHNGVLDALAANPAFFFGDHISVPGDMQASAGTLTGPAQTVDTTNFHIIAVDFIQDTSANFLIDAGSLQSGASGVGSSTGGLALGIYANTFGVDGYIAEALFYTKLDSPFTSGSGLLIRRYLNDKYKLGLSI